MGFLNIFGSNPSKESEQIKRRKSLRNRLCRIEEVERRELLSANPFVAPDPISIGVVYHEEYYKGSVEDRNGDTFTVSWNGGAADTTLDKIVIDLRTAKAKEIMYFNVDPSSPQAKNGGASPFTISSDDNGVFDGYSISADGQVLEIHFKNFSAGDVFTFKIDVNLKDSNDILPLVPGAHFDGSKLTATFGSVKYETLTFQTNFADAFTDPSTFNLSVPPDDYFTDPENSRAAMTAGVVEKIPETQKALPGSLSGYVYEDVNNDGIKAATEKGINGVWLELYVLDETTGRYETTGRKTQTSNDTAYGNGYYVFDAIEGGRTYKIIEAQPAGYLDGKDTPGTIDGTQVGRAVPSDEIDGIHIGAKENGINYNFGELKSASVSGYVYHDRDNDGIRGTGEEGIAGVELQLWVLDNGRYFHVTGMTATTDANGYYEFAGLDPFKTYRVTETQPTGWDDGKEAIGTVNGVKVGTALQDDKISNVYLGYDEHGVEYDFGEIKRGSIGGTVYEDDDNDGKKDPGEKGIPGVEIWLCVVDENGDKVNIKKTVTDTNGNYFFGDLDPGKTYCVTEVQPEEYCDGITTPGTVDGSNRGTVNKEIPAGHNQVHDIYLGSGEDAVNYNFGEGQKGLISGYVYEDTNKNGVKDSGEKGIQGVVLSLWVWNGSQYVQTAKTATTDVNGYYEFTGLCPFNKYQIRETQPTAYNDGEETVGSLGGDKSVNDIISEINMPAGGKGTDYNFGELVKPVEPPAKGSLSGYVYVDTDKSGTKDSGEAGIGSVTLTLWKLVNGTYVNTGKTATTNSSGYYIFSGIDPNETYLIAETQPTAYDDGRESVGSLGGTLPETDNDTIRDILVGPGQHGTDYNFGEFVKAVTPDPKPGSLSGYVYVDANKNGVRDAGETGIAGVKLTLTKTGDASYKKYATTDANGYYIFTGLDPNETYEISEEQPITYDDGEETVGSLGGNKSVNDMIFAIVVGSDQHGVNYNFGELVKTNPPDPVKGSLSGYVYVDSNKNGTRDSGEPGIAGVTITLTKTGDPDFKRTTTTDSNGFYIFADLDPNCEYHLAEAQPTAYDDGRENVGSIGGELPSADDDTILRITVTEGATGTDYNFGEFVKPDPIDPIDPPVIPPSVVPPPSIPISPYRMPGATGVGGATMSPSWQFPTPSTSLQAGYGGGALQSGYSWHLSVVNAGNPREATTTAQGFVASNDTRQQTMILEDGVLNGADATDTARYVSVAWTSLPMNQSVWYVRDKAGKIAKRFSFGPNGGKPLVGDFNGDGIAEIAVYHNGNWYVDLNGNGVWDEGDLLCQLGTASDQPVVGDWDGDGKTDIGIFGPQWNGDAAIIAEEPGLPSDLNSTVTSRPKNMPPDVAINGTASNVRAMKHSASGMTRLDVIDHVFQYGDEGDQAFTGDFSGDGITKVGIYRNGNWYVDYNGNGRWDDGDIYIENASLGLGKDGVAVVGDWNGDGIDKIGLFVDGVWHLDTTGNFQFDTTIEFGEKGDMPVVGDFSGDGIAQLSVVRPSHADSLMTQRTTAPASSVSSSAPMYATNAAEASGQANVANENSDGNDAAQKTLPEKLQRHGRSMRTPHTDAPLHRHHDR